MHALLLGLGLALAAGRGEHRVVERTFSSELELHTDSFDLQGSEEGRDVQQEGPRSVREQADEIEIVDTFLDDEDPPARFSRLYRSITSAFKMGLEKAPKERTTTAELEKKTVLFERQEDGTWERSSEDADARPVQLRRLRANLSLRPFLPADDPEEGAEWEIEPADLLRLVAPLEERFRSRAPKGKPAKKGLDLAPVSLAEPLGNLMGELEGSCTATRIAGEDGDGDWPRQARLAFRLSSSFDGSETLVPNRDAEVEDDLELTWEGTGTLSWDSGEQRIEITLQGDLRMRERFKVEVEGNGKTGTATGDLVVTGTLALEAHEAPGS